MARKFASLDIVSEGRAGWNLITSGNETEAQNFGRISHPPKAERYRRAREFAEVVNGLWQSWDDDPSSATASPEYFLILRKCTFLITTVSTST